MSNVYKLPDAYAKAKSSNNYKLLDLSSQLCADFETDIKAIFDSRDFTKATGKTLDRYGEMIGQSRDGETDEQYRMKIKSRMGRLASDGSCDKTIKLIAEIIGTESENISIREDNMKVSVHGMTMDVLKNSGYKSAEVTELIKEVLPICVGLEPPVYAGTLFVMGDVVKLSETEVCSTDANGNYQFDKRYGFDNAETIEKYPTLRCALGYGWCYNTPLYNYLELGLAGTGCDYGNMGSVLPSAIMSGTFEGGTLGITSGEDA